MPLCAYCPHVAAVHPRASMTAEHRVLVIARDRQLGIDVVDTVEALGFTTRGPVGPMDADAIVRNYASRGLGTCAVVVDHDPAIASGVLHQSRSLTGLVVVAVGRFEQSRDVAALLDAGAVDVVRVDVAADELAARLRRGCTEAAATAGSHLSVADLIVDIARRTVTKQGASVALTRTEFDLLVCLVRKADRVVPAGDLMREVLGHAADADPHVLTVHIQRLRLKVESDPKNPALITSVRGIGYMLVTECGT